MKINLTKQYLADFRRLSSGEKESVLAALELFQENPLDPALRNHALEGRLKGLRALAADEDLRIIIRDHGNYAEVTLIAVGGHCRIYRK